MALGSLALEFFNKEAVVDDKNVGRVTQKKYFEFAAEQGITKEMLEKMNDFNTEITNGAYLFCNEKVQAGIETAKKAKEDPSKVKAGLKVTIPGGHFETTMSAAKRYPLPKQPGEYVVKTNVTSQEFVQHRLLDKDTLVACEDATRKALGL